MALIDALNYLKETKNLIKQAIIDKGVAISDTDTFRNYAAKIKEISGGSGEAGGITIKEGETRLDNVCSYGNIVTTSPEALAYIASYTKRNNITSISSMFEGCSGITSIPYMETAYVKSMRSTFKDCRKLTSIPAFNFSQVEFMDHIFYSCEQITELPPMDTSKAKDMSYMFQNCKELTKVENLDFTSINSNATYAGVGYLFGNSYNGTPKLTYLTFNPNQKSFSVDKIIFDLTPTGIISDAEATILFESLPDLTLMDKNNHHTIKLKADNTISENVKKIAIDKGWTLTQ